MNILDFILVVVGVAAFLLIGCSILKFFCMKRTINQINKMPDESHIREIEPYNELDDIVNDDDVNDMMYRSM